MRHHAETRRRKAITGLKPASSVGLTACSKRAPITTPTASPGILRSTGRYLVIYLLIVVGMALLFLRLPSSFLPEEDQGILLTMVQLPAGATEARTSKVLEEVTDYFLTKEKDNVVSVFTVAGFGFNGNGQNNGLSFVSLKDWSERKGEENKVPAIAGRAMGAFSQIKDGLVFPFNLPAIIELGTATGFDFQLIDQGGLGPRKTD